MRTVTRKLKTVAIGLFLVFMFLSVDIAYGLGGGGHHGDGRWEFTQPTVSASPNAGAPANGNSGSSDVQQGAAGEYSGGSGSFWVTAYHWTEECGNDVVEGGNWTSVQQPVMVPEPVGALLLGLGVIGFACIRRRFER